MDAPIVDAEALEAWLQCERRAWLQRHAPDRARPGTGLGPFLALQRADLGRAMQRRFGAGRVVAAPSRPVDGDLLEVLASGRRVVLGATFEGGTPASESASYRLRGRIDALERRSHGWHAYALAAGARVRDHHLRRLALAALAARQAGTELARSSVLHVGRGPDADPELLQAKDVARGVTREAQRLPAYLEALGVSLRTDREPATSVGSHCRRPRPCPFLDHCRARVGGRSLDQVWGLTAASRRALRSAGWNEAAAVPADAPGLSQEETRALADARRGTVRVERPALRAALGRLRPPVAFLDIEFATPAVPLVDGMRPFEPLPFQFSLDLEDGHGVVRHDEELRLDEGTDPRPALAGRLASLLAGAGSIVVYDAASEGKLLDALTAFEPALGRAPERLWDLQRVVRDNVRHPGFEARWDLKHVAEALGTGSYAGVRGMDGLTAQASWRRLLRRPDARTERELRRYCAADSRAMVDIVRTLRRWLPSEPT